MRSHDPPASLSAHREDSRTAMTYDLVIVGSGPAGLTAAQYARRRGFETLVLERESVGGELVNRHHIETYPGFPDGIAGTDLRSRLVSTLEELDPEVRLEAVESVAPGDPHVVHTDADTYEARALLVATGASHADLGVPGEGEYDGAGVFYCAQCDGPLYRDEHVAVVGGSDHALTDALFLTDFADSVTLVSREDSLEAGDHLRERAADAPDLDVLLDTEVTAIDGTDGVVESLALRDVETDESRTLPVGGLYVCTGTEPNTSFLDGTVPLTDDGSVAVGPDLMSDVDGVFAAGDTRQDAGHEVAAAVGDGAVAARSITHYLDDRD
ncbi:MAG: NAD(P)/FAD-dependent oxidoreductase [Haloarculaceae archaeon]